MSAQQPSSEKRSIFITGCLGDIGGASALRLAQDGHRVTVSGRLGPEAGAAAVAALAGSDTGVSERLSYGPT